MMRALKIAALAVVTMVTMTSATYATTCAPLTDADPSCGLKAAVEAKYGAGYCATLYSLQNGGATLEVFYRYTNAGLDDGGTTGNFTMEVFPSFLDDDCTIKVTFGDDPTYHHYGGINIAATPNIETTPGEEEYTVTLDPDQFEYTFSGLDFKEHQLRFDSNFYDDSDVRYGSTTQNDYFAPAIPTLTALSMETDGTFYWTLPTGIDEDTLRADIVFYEITDTGLEFTTFTTKYAPTESWDYYDWNNVGAGYYVLYGTTALKVYYDDVLIDSATGETGVVNHNIWNEWLYSIVEVSGHQVVSIDGVSPTDEVLINNLEACAANAESGENCTTVTASDLEAYMPDTTAPTLSSDVESGTYTSVQTVTLTCNETPCSIYYTTDGTTPDNSSTAYTAPITVSASTTINAIAYDGANNPSSVLTLSIVINLPEEEEEDTAPEATTITKANKSKVEWSAVTGATYYELQILKKKTGAKLFGVNDITDTFKKFKKSQKKKMKKGKKYIAQVRACNDIGCSDWASKNFKAKK